MALDVADIVMKIKLTTEYPPEFLQLIRELQVCPTPVK